MTTHTRPQTVSKPLHHFTAVGKIGYPQGVRCWCGASLAFSLHEPGQDAKRRAFFDSHEECGPVEVKHVE